MDIWWNWLASQTHVEELDKKHAELQKNAKKASQKLLKENKFLETELKKANTELEKCRNGLHTLQEQTKSEQKTIDQLGVQVALLKEMLHDVDRTEDAEQNIVLETIDINDPGDFEDEKLDSNKLDLNDKRVLRQIYKELPKYPGSKIKRLCRKFGLSLVGRKLERFNRLNTRLKTLLNK